MKNKYFICSHILEKRFGQIIKFFGADLTAPQIAFLFKIDCKTINKILENICLNRAETCE